MTHISRSFQSLWLAFVLAGIWMVGVDCATAQTPTTSKTEQPEMPAPSNSARELFSKNKERLLQVRVLLASANEQSSLGSGFLVQDSVTNSAWVVTNYHVVSALAIDPEKYRIELRSTSERTVRAALFAVDVIHDLAVLRIDASAPDATWKTFALRDKALEQGSKVFSLGNPLELGFLISEGIYNGLVESRIYKQMLFSGAINSGMSGGPAIDETGQVVGVNVATRRDGEALSFLVPVQYVRALLQQAQQTQPRHEWRTEIARQLQQHQDTVVSKLLGQAQTEKGKSTGAVVAGFDSQTLVNRTVTTLSGNLTKCWATGGEGEKLRYQRDSVQCSLHADLFVHNNFYTGSVSIRHVLLRNEKLSTQQFIDITTPLMGTSWRGGAEITRNECKGNYVQGAQHVYRVSLCMRAYKKFEGLYDYTLDAVQVDESQERMVSSLQLQGLSFKNAQRLGSYFLESLK
jgi:serine protease Do